VRRSVQRRDRDQLRFGWLRSRCVRRSGRRARRPLCWRHRYSRLRRRSCRRGRDWRGCLIRCHRRPRTRQWRLRRARRYRPGDVRSIGKLSVRRRAGRRLYRARGMARRRRRVLQVWRRGSIRRLNSRNGRCTRDVSARTHRLIGKARVVSGRRMENATVARSNHHPQLATHIVRGQQHVCRTATGRLCQRPQAGCAHNPEDFLRRQSGPRGCRNRRIAGRRLGINGLCVRRRCCCNSKHGQAHADSDLVAQGQSPCSCYGR
jgi:hypothetical protein